MFTGALALAREAGDQFFVWLVLRNLGQAAREREDYATALARYEEAYAAAQEDGRRDTVMNTHVLLGELTVLMGDHARGTRLLTDVMAMWQPNDEAQDRTNALLRLGEIALHEGDVQRAAARYAENLAMVWEQRDQPGVADIICRMAAMAEVAGEPVEGIAAWWVTPEGYRVWSGGTVEWPSDA
jgi:tetratricopeptide (TPR) repeat protein